MLHFFALNFLLSFTATTTILASAIALLWSLLSFQLSPSPYFTISGYITVISRNSFIHTDISLAHRDAQTYLTCFKRLTRNSQSPAALLSSFSSRYFFPSKSTSMLAHHNICRRSATWRSLKESPCPVSVLISVLLCLRSAWASSSYVDDSG